MNAREITWKNPVIIKEIRTRMRGSRIFILLTLHLVFLGLIVSLAYILFRTSISPSGSYEERRTFGKAIFGLLIWIELIAISFIAPALTSGSISAERERQTLDLLRVTLLPTIGLVLGKYLSGLVFILLLLFTSLPMFGSAFIFGGVLPEEIIIAVLILISCAVAFCAIGIFLSSIFPRTIISIVLSYAMTIFLVFGLPVLFLVLLIMVNTASTNLINQMSPLVERFTIILGWLLVSISPMATMIATEAIILDQRKFLWANFSLNPDNNLTIISPWISFTLIYLALSILLLMLSILLVKKIDT